MNKRSILGLVVLSALIALAAQVFLGGFISARLAQIPWLSKFQIINPQAPIVINKKEIVRADDTQDVINTINNVKPRLAAIVMVSGSTVNYSGNALAITADGSFVTTIASFPQNGVTYAVALSDGRIAPITSQVLDPATELVFFKATISGLAVTTFTPLPSNVGDRAVFVEGTINQASPVAYPTFITKTEQENVNRTFNADNPSRVFGVDIPNGLASGSSLVALNGDSLGIWSGSKIISNGIIKRAVDLYLSNNLVRPKFGFNYETLTVTKAKLLGLSEGIRVTLLTKSGPASQAGLKEGDIITKVGETQVINQPQFEQLLESYLPTQIVPLSIVRGQQSLIINLASQKLE
jgi:putative serine protease PepD